MVSTPGVPQGLQIHLWVHRELKPMLQIDVLLTITTACYYYATTCSTLLCLGILQNLNLIAYVYSWSLMSTPGVVSTHACRLCFNMVSTCGVPHALAGRLGVHTKSKPLLHYSSAASYFVEQ